MKEDWIGKGRWRPTTWVLEMFRELLFFYQKHVPEYGPYQWGFTYYVQIVNPIPRFPVA